MGKQFSALKSRHISFIEAQKLFFVATAMQEGRINLSPKGLDSFRVLSPELVVWINLTGSGNETATHLQQDGRMTLMFCALEGKPEILRLYGRARAYHPRDDFWKDNAHLFPDIPGSRQLIAMELELVQTSCGMGIPIYSFEKEREELKLWAENKGEAGLKAYWAEKNSHSLDGHQTGILE